MGGRYHFHHIGRERGSDFVFRLHYSCSAHGSAVTSPASP